MLIIFSLMICIYPCITSNTGEFICMFIIKQSIWAIPVITRDDGFPGPRTHVKSCSAENDEEGTHWWGKATNCFEVVIWDATLGYWGQVFARHTNGRCSELHVTRRTISKFGRVHKKFFRIQTFISLLCANQPAPRKKKMCGRLKKLSEPWWNSRSWYIYPRPPL